MRAVGFLGQVIIGVAEGSRSAAHADFAVFADAAFSFEIFIIPQIAEDRALSPDLR